MKLTSLIRLLSLYLCFIQMVIQVSGQNCNITIQISVIDQNTVQALPLAVLHIAETSQNYIANESGNFVVHSLCRGEYHLQLSHLGYEDLEQTLYIRSDTLLFISLIYQSTVLNQITVEVSSNDHDERISNTISRNEIAQESNKNFADILENIPGVQTIRNGSGISKPTIHGLSGNRLSIMNNGLPQSGQQWGNDHAPEIDAFVADNIIVVRGASSLAYPGAQSGAIILVEPRKITSEKKILGSFNFITQSNGSGQTLNTALEQRGKFLGWRASATIKLIGDRKTPDYYLTNTGQHEGSASIHFEKNLSDSWRSTMYYSYFQTELGLLRGSQIGNISDLEEAFGRPEPFNTSENFSFQIAEPKQRVKHHLLKITSKYYLTPTASLHFNYGIQLNDREEYDIRRGDRSSSPALSMTQWSHFSEAIFKKFRDENNSFSAGLQYWYIDNANQPETGILPLIPDYYSYQGSAYAIFQRSKQKAEYDIGLRYDVKDLFVWSISESLPREIRKVNHLFENYSLSGGINYTPSEAIKISTNIILAKRSPEVNEMYSFGLHQGVSGIEEGDPNLTEEKSAKLTTSFDIKVGPKLTFQILGYYHRFIDFIYLEPQEELRLTIRGAFPVFQYKQTNAEIMGSDLSLTYLPHPKFRLTLISSWLRGKNISRNLPLVFMPSSRIQGHIRYLFRNTEALVDNHLTISCRYVARQSHLREGQDFYPVPADYFLLGFSASTTMTVHGNKLQITLSGENILNKKYRDYLNRLRYFADEQGMNLILRVGMNFN